MSLPQSFLREKRWNLHLSAAQARSPGITTHPFPCSYLRPVSELPESYLQRACLTSVSHSVSPAPHTSPSSSPGLLHSHFPSLHAGPASKIYFPI